MRWPGTAVHVEDSSGKEWGYSLFFLLHTEAKDVFAYSFLSSLFIGVVSSEYSNFRWPSQFQSLWEWWWSLMEGSWTSSAVRRTMPGTSWSPGRTEARVAFVSMVLCIHLFLLNLKIKMLLWSIGKNAECFSLSFPTSWDASVGESALVLARTMPSSYCQRWKTRWWYCYLGWSKSSLWLRARFLVPEEVFSELFSSSSNFVCGGFSIKSLWWWHEVIPEAALWSEGKP